ncbi:MAG: SpoIIE family protein phosphatase [Candidatus Melainabacteria bacterium]|nr:SpoIIE family protein phosphatase [Candidatus Melainabacteria bacterium]
MAENESKTKSFETNNLNAVDSSTEIAKLKKQLEQERFSTEKREKIMAQSLQESKQMSAHLQQITQELAKERKVALEKSETERLLWKLIERINSSFDLEHILQSTVDELGNYFKVDRCGIIIPSYKSSRDLVREYATGEWKRKQETYSQVSLSALYRTVTETFKPLIINDTITHSLTAGHLSEDLRSILMVPLVQYNDELVGVVYLHQCRNQRNWTEHELSLLQAAAGPIATAVEKSKLFNKAKSWASREKLLNRLTSRIRGTLNINVILERTVAELGQALQASRCFINIIDHKTTRERISHEYAVNKTELIGTGKENPLIINKIAEKDEECISIADIYKEPRLVKLNNKEIEQLYKTNARAFLAVPITFQRNLYGWLCFHQCHVPRNWTNEEISFIQSAASQVGVAINQAEMVGQLTEYQTKLSRELKQAAQLQSVLLNAGADTNKNLPIAVSYHPHHNVSGDFYWISELAPHVVAILIGDVSGKGPAASLLTGYIIGEMKGLLENQATSWHPEKFLTALSDSICEQNQHSDFYATAWYGIFNLIEGKVLCSNAGHPSPCIIKDGNVSRLNDDPGVPLGLFSVNDALGNYVVKEFKLNPSDRMVIFTDGLTEQRELDGKFIPESWLIEALRAHKNSPINELPEEIIRKLNMVSKAAPADDDRLVVAIEMLETKTIEFDEDGQNYINEKIKAILEDAASHGLPKNLEASLKLGLVEALYNSFRHGLKKAGSDNDSNAKVTLSWWVKESAISCTIKDPGPGFNWQTTIQNKSKIKDVDILSEGGRGLPLLFEIFSKVTWNPKGNEIGLTMNW